MDADCVVVRPTHRMSNNGPCPLPEQHVLGLLPLSVLAPAVPHGGVGPRALWVHALDGTTRSTFLRRLLPSYRNAQAHAHAHAQFLRAAQTTFWQGGCQSNKSRRCTVVRATFAALLSAVRSMMQPDRIGSVPVAELQQEDV